MNKIYNARERYQTDPEFKGLVDQMTAAIINNQYTPSEMREASILASIKYEEMTPTRTYMPIWEDALEMMGVRPTQNDKVGE